MRFAKESELIYPNQNAVVLEITKQTNKENCF